LYVEERKDKWWVMCKSEGFPQPNPVGQRLVKMEFGPMLKVVHSTKEEAEKEMEWVKNHVAQYETRRAKTQRKKRRVIS
jgi:hypothetical protein